MFRPGLQAMRPALRSSPIAHVLPAFRHAPPSSSARFFFAHPPPPPPSTKATPLALLRSTARRAFTTDQTPILARPPPEKRWAQFGASAAVVVGTAVAVHMFFNRETREGGMRPIEREYLHSTFKYLGAGLAIVAGSAVALHRSGWSVRLMTMNPWLVMGVSLVGSIGSMYGVFSTPPEKQGQKLFWWTAFNLMQAGVLSPLLFFNPAILARAGLYTAGLMGSICYVGATAKNDKYLWLGAPLLGGVTVVALSGLAPMVLPLGVRGLAIAESISLYGGLAVFTGFTLWDTQKILHHARMVEQGQMKPDPIAESISLELDFINIFVRLVQILTNQQQRKR